jgi:hypothetical protein
MKRTSYFGIAILVVVGLIIGYFVYDSQNFWDGMSCEEMFDFAMSPEHQELTMEQHMEFHKDYEPCNQNP